MTSPSHKIVTLCCGSMLCAMIGCTQESFELFPDAEAEDQDMSLADLDRSDLTDMAPERLEEYDVIDAPSCRDLPVRCGEDASQSCCQSPLVGGNAPGSGLEGDPFYLDFDEADGLHRTKRWPAQVSDYRLDRYEVTVARFRRFLEDYARWRAEGNPVDSAGDLGPRANTSWQPAWDVELGSSRTEVERELSCENFQTWTSSPGPYEELPITCVDWYHANAFCLWDGGYLPTEAQWMYASAGGTQQRAFPWSDPARSTAIDTSFANYDCEGDEDIENCAVTDLRRPGTYPRGRGRWGHEDLSGNVGEWVFDTYVQEPPYPGQIDQVCLDCAQTQESPVRVIKGGTYKDNSPFPLRSPDRAVLFTVPAWNFGHVGFRCAREP